ncbi:MAG: 3-hydroxyacyl-CoA dehydrogenase family protein [Promethearchaeota archaeon]
MEIKKICIIGAGVMGSGIAQLIALNGYSVNLLDLSVDLLKNIKDKIEQNIDRHYVARNKLSKEEARKILNNIHYYTNIEEAVDNVQLVIEAIYEVMNLKQVLFAKLDSICEKHVILASNTSSLSITDIASKSKHQDRIVGIHFFNPATVMKLIELIKGDNTTDETLEIAKDFSKGLKKTVVTIKDSPGFVTSRLIYVLCNEAINMKMEGIASTEDIDTACKLAFNFPMGPLELSDLVGLDIYNNIGEYLNNEFGDKYKPSFLLKEKVRKNQLGRKSRKGFYDY